MTTRIAAIVAALGCLSTAAAQGRADYFNVETPVGQALAVARIANHDYLLVCNTPDNSVEIYDTDESGTGLPLLARIPVGLEPNSILWDASRNRVYVTCFLNDSLDSFVLSAPTGPGSLTYVLDQSRNLGFDPSILPTDPQTNLGDEPMDLALTPDNSVLLVSFGSKSAIGAFNPVTLDPVGTSNAFPAPTENILLQASIGNPPVQHAFKEPRTIEVFGDKLFVLNHKGGTTAANPFGVQNYDFDLYARVISGPTAGTVVPMGNLGSTNWNMRFSTGGDLYVVGGLARIDLIGGPAVAGATTGFVESKLYRVTGAGTAGATVIERDLNVVFSGMFAMVVPKSQALAMPTDLVVLEGSPTKVYVAAFGSDRVGVITLVNPALPKTWTIARIAIPLAPLSTNPRTGPRSLVLKTATGGGLPDPGDRVYVLNRMDHSVSIINPQNNSVETFALGQGYDPTPAHIRNGREFLYSADLSNSGFVSCASCHGDGRTDSLGWNLGSPTGFSAPFPSSFIDSPSGADLEDVEDLLTNGFDPDKGMLITQTLQGLLDTEVAPEVQDLVTNAPYHWRGDRARFTDFNEAFANLLGLGCQFGPCGPGDLPMGIDPADMEDFEEFVNSIHYPPNPKELETRLFQGDLGDADIVGVADTPTGGSDALRGMKLFHIRPLGGNLNGRSCVQCHALPRGSNLKYTDSRTPPLETAQVRGLFQRELRFQVDGNDIVMPSTSPLAGMFGLSHAGGRGTINSFINLFALPDEDHKDVNQFIHQFDWGVAPVVGRVQRVVVGNAASTLVDDRLDLFEAQAGLGNCGLAARGAVGSGSIGYWYDPTQGLYVQESTGANPISRATLLGLVTGTRHRIFFRCTPLGSERRVAAVTGVSASLGGSAPGSLDLLGLVPNTAWSLVPTMDVNWIPVAQGGTFDWSHPTMRTPRFLRAIRRFQYGLIDPNNQSNYGLPALRHDAARRFRVAGNNILPGAKLVIWTPNDTSGAPPDTNANPPDPAKTRRLEFPLYATSATDAGRPVWETAAELAPIQYYALMNGGIEAPGVQATLDDWQSLGGDILPSGTFNPDQFNWHFVQVVNPDGGTGTALWERLTVQ